MKSVTAWKTASLGSILERVALPVNVEADREYREIGIRSHGKGIFHKPPISGASLGDKRVFWVVPEALVLNIVFAWEQAVAVTGAQELGMIASHRFPMYKANPGLCDVNYLLHYFKTRRGKELLEIASPGGAGRNKTLGQQAFDRLRIPLPPPTEQTNIATALSTWDRAIDALTKAFKASDSLHQELREKLIQGCTPIPISKPGRTRRLPLEALGTTFSGLTGKSKDDFGTGSSYIPYLNIFKNSRIDINEIGYVRIGEAESQNRCQYGDIFFTTSSETPDEVGMSSVLLDRVDELYLNSFCFGFRLHNFDTLLPEYARFLLRSTDFRLRVRGVAQGSTRFNLSKKGLLKLDLPIPSLEDQRKIAEVLTISERLLFCQSRMLSVLRNERQLLAQILISGKRRLTQIPGRS